MAKLRTLHLSIPVDSKNDMSMTLDRYSKLTLTEQQNLTDRMSAEFPYQGQADFEEGYCRPECLKGVDLNDLEEIMENSRSRIDSNLKEVVKNQKRFGKSYNQIYDLN